MNIIMEVVKLLELGEEKNTQILNKTFNFNIDETIEILTGELLEEINKKPPIFRELLPVIFFLNMTSNLEENKKRELFKVLEYDFYSFNPGFLNEFEDKKQACLFIIQREDIPPNYRRIACFYLSQFTQIEGYFDLIEKCLLNIIYDIHINIYELYKALCLYDYICKNQIVEISFIENYIPEEVFYISNSRYQEDYFKYKALEGKINKINIITDINVELYSNNIEGNKSYYRGKQYIVADKILYDEIDYKCVICFLLKDKANLERNFDIHINKEIFYIVGNYLLKRKSEKAINVMYSLLSDENVKIKIKITVINMISSNTTNKNHLKKAIEIIDRYYPLLDNSDILYIEELKMKIS